MLKVTFRVVGLYCYLPVLRFDNLNPSSTVKQVMDTIAATNPGFSYDGGDEVHSMGYTFTDQSVEPNNVLRRPANGFRDLSESLGNTALVWQYYRSVTVPIGGTNYEVKIISPGQPKFSVTPLNQDLIVPPGSSSDICFNLTWRLVQIQLTPEALQARLAARQKSMAMA